MAAKVNQYIPDYAIHPGEYLEEVLEAREIKKRDFAERVGLSDKAVSQIINGRSLYSPEVALQLEKTLGINAEIWMNMADSYQLFKAREEEKKELESEKTKKWVQKFPISDLKRLGILTDTRRYNVLAEELLRFFTVASPETWKEYYDAKAVSYRKSSKYKESHEATAVWLKFAEIEAVKIETKNYDKDQFKNALSRIRSFTRERSNKFYPKMVELCGKAGVAVVLVPELKGTHISGATFWATQHKAVIALSLRYRSNDHFWFTFFHEAAHILMHPKKAIFIDIKDDGGTEEEKEANEYAGEILIPEDEYEKFVEDNDFFKTNILSFADHIEIHPGIVVGRLQHDGLIRHSWHNTMKEKYEIVRGGDE